MYILACISLLIPGFVPATQHVHSDVQNQVSGHPSATQRHVQFFPSQLIIPNFPLLKPKIWIHV